MRILALSLVAFLTTSSSFAGVPLTPEEWQQMHAACIKGMNVVANQTRLGSNFPELYCGCVEGELKKLPADQWDAKFGAIHNICLELSAPQ